MKRKIGILLLLLHTACLAPGDETPLLTLYSLTFKGTLYTYFTNFQAANLVLGQADFTSLSANRGGTTVANSMNAPFGRPLVIGNRLYISDGANHRVLGFNAIPTVSGVAADFVIGQVNMTDNTSGTGLDQLNLPRFLASDGNMLLVADYNNHRILRFDSAPVTTNPTADRIFGVTGTTACAAGNFNGPLDIYITNGRALVTDQNNNRVLLWNDAVGAASGAPADMVLGQSNFVNCTLNDDDQNGSADLNPTSRTLATPAGLWSDGNRIIVSDYGNNRVLIWNSWPVVNFQPADMVLGQADMTSKASGAGATGLNGPFGIESNGVQLYLADNLNHRILIWNSMPTKNGAVANNVLGQNNFANIARNDSDQDGTTDAPSASTLNRPASLSLYGSILMVSDAFNHRVLFFSGRSVIQY